ncbi:hypothetical protein GMOD_00004141 [Pyrenophora seminiperda CCB06]|uniref:Uncharacterized protein n=1 Tax=Pyrenophora seminiperda CCB06 TaxID=1302712 RepID=A0A3M7M0L2_9PLEO|nr:hypothetical protein GMOD_00004141 [Pyrenophora seminiperda CCB06]
MPPASSSFTPLNVPDDVVPEWLGSFTLAAPPNTDLWRKPPTGDTSTAPILYTALRNPFIAAEVTVSADWELEWDQGGLVIFAGAPPGQIAIATAAAAANANATTLDVPNIASISLDEDNSAAASPATLHSQTSSIPDPENFVPSQDSTQQDRSVPPPAYFAPVPASKWVKVGLEFCNNACHATSVVANCEGADWSLSALPPHQQRRLALRVKIERIGYALWVWYEDELLGWKKLREVTWFFWGVEDKAVRVGVYASRPANFGISVFERRGGTGGFGGLNRGARNLCVDFEGLEIF